MKTNVYIAVVAAMIGGYSSVASAASVTTDFVTNTQIQVEGSKGGNYGFTLTMEEGDTMYYSPETEAFVSQKINGLKGKASMTAPSTMDAPFTLTAMLDPNGLGGQSNALLFKGVPGVAKGVKLAPVVAGVTLTDASQEIPLRDFVGSDGQAGFVDTPVVVSLVQDGYIGVADGTELPTGQYAGHADIAWTATFTTPTAIPNP
ncbi:MAG: hypothetical protein ACRCVV_09075 [Shewanella sp.]